MPLPKLTIGIRSLPKRPRSFERGEYDQALLLTEQALQSAEAQLGAEHSEVADLLGDLGVLHDVRGRYTRRPDLLREGPQGARDRPGCGSSRRGAQPREPCARLLARWLTTAKPRSCAAASLPSRSGPSAPTTRRSPTPSMISAKYARLRALFDEAERFYRLALEIRERAFGQGHARVARSYDNLASLFTAKGDVEARRHVLRTGPRDPFRRRG